MSLAELSMKQAVKVDDKKEKTSPAASKKDK